MKKILLLIAYFGVLTSAAAQVKLEVTLDSSRILIGDQTRLHLALTQRPNWTAFFPTKISLGENIEILEEIGIDTTTESNGDVTIRKDLIITAWDSGQIKVPAIAVAFQNPNTNTVDTIFSRPIFLNVSTVALTDSSDLKPIKEILEEAADWTDYQKYFLMLGILLLAGGIVWYFMRRKKEVELPPPPPVILPAHEIALSRLFQLSKEELWQKGQIKEYQSALTQILRSYLNERYRISALESTSFEIIQALKDKLTTEQTTKLREMLEVADLVKFAKAKPPVDWNEQLMKDAVKFVKETGKKEVLNNSISPS